MPVQMYLNQGPQDQLLFCSDRSYFTNTGYTCTTNFQLEYRDVDPVSTAKLGSTARFVIPKAADLLGHVDLLATVNKSDGGGAYGSSATDNAASAWYWVNKLGFAMIEKITMTIGSNLIEEITGEQLDLINELMREGKDKLGWHTIMRDCKPASTNVHLEGAITAAQKGNAIMHAGRGGNVGVGGTLQGDRGFSRLICATAHDDGDTVVRGTGHKLIVPLGLFFSKHPSQYFPLGAIAGCNDVVLEIKFRPLAHLRAFNHDDNASTLAITKPTVATNGEFVTDIKLRCTYVHLTGPEAALQMNKEHVRLMRQWKNLNFTKSIGEKTDFNWQVDLSFLHPVSFLVITFRKTDHIDQADEAATAVAAEKGYFQYYGDGRVPTLDHEAGNATTAKDNLKLNSISLTLNGQERHPGLTANKLDNHYLKYRVLPQLFSSSDHSEELLEQHQSTEATDTAARAELQSHRHELLGAKNVYVYPFCIHPEGANPSGSVNFSKVSHAKLSCNVDITAATDTTPEWRMDVYAVGYNWLQIKDGRGLLSFA
tara:strand:+ start:271 stop:1890 length:1620 start_codon:yes stop_codon:yes gene_type:complete